MKKTSYLLSLILVIQVFTLNLNAQENKKENKTYKNNLTLNVGRLFLNEARFGYERKLTGRHSLRTVLGVKYPTSSESFNTIPVSAGHIPNHYKVSKGFFLGAGYNYTIGKQSQIYLSTEVYFNYNYYDKKYYHYCVGMDMESYVSLESMKLKKTGIKFIIGKKARIVSGNKVGLELDFFVGLGIQYRIEELTIFEKLNGSCSYDYSELYVKDPPEINTSKNWYPTLHAGILLGMPF